MNTDNEENKIHSYGSIFNMGHKCIENLFKGPVIVEEKIDGSQFSFGRIGDKLFCRSKGIQIDIDHPEKMFALAVEQVKKRFMLLQDGWTYRGEYLRGPKHNSLKYERTPIDNIILFDVDMGQQAYMTPRLKKEIGERLGFEVTPIYHFGTIKSLDFLHQFLSKESILGGKIEGIVIKNYMQFGFQFGIDKKILMGKIVSKEFTEMNKVEWKKSNPQQADILQAVIQSFGKEAVWKKAVQHLRDNGKLLNEPQDIGPLLKEVATDLEKEARQIVADKFADWAMPQVIRKVSQGLPEWYKQQLAQEQKF